MPVIVLLFSILFLSAASTQANAQRNAECFRPEGCGTGYRPQSRSGPSAPSSGPARALRETPSRGVSHNRERNQARRPLPSGDPTSGRAGPPRIAAPTMPSFDMPSVETTRPGTSAEGSTARTRAALNDMSFDDMDKALEERRPAGRMLDVGRAVSPELDRLVGRIQQAQEIAENTMDMLLDPKGALFDEFRSIRDTARDRVVNGVLSGTIARKFGGDQHGDPLVKRFSDAAADTLLTAPRNVLDRIRSVREVLKETIDSKFEELKEMIRLI